MLFLGCTGFLPRQSDDLTLEDAALKKQQIDPALKKRFFFRVLDLQL
jgi:hypothetical protein